MAIDALCLMPEALIGDFMKSLYFTSEHEAFRNTVRSFVEREVAPHGDTWERERRIPRFIWKRMGDLGFLGINHPEAYGGTAADFFYSVVFLEELNRSTMGGFSAAVSVHSYMAMEYITRFGTEALKREYLVPAITGDKIGALAVTEPNTGSDVAAIRTRAVRDGEHYILSGSKTFITNGVFGDFVLVAAKTDPPAGVGGISLILVDRDAPGFTARQLHKIGWHCSDTAELSFDEVRVPVTRLIGEENRGFYYIMQCFQLERLVSAVLYVSGAALCLEATLKYIAEREAFNRSLSKFQVIRHTLAGLKAELEAARQLTYYTCWLHNARVEAVGYCSMAKLISTELMKKMADTCLQYYGGYGYMDEYLMSRIYRDARVGTIVGGTSEIMREIIARLMIDQVSYGTVPAESARPPAEEPVRGIEGSAMPEPAKTMPTTAAEMIRSLPDRFRPEKAGDWETVFHFDVAGPGGGRFTVMVRKGVCTVEDGLKGAPECVVKTSDHVYRDVELGKANAEMALITGKIKISDLAEMMRFIKAFRRLPKA